ncbi:MAG: HEAT repeat domain-containing protein [Candidatus Riflebacteria bacterium]|nr:HEAT repeat domain-containing protein [Candidatus Riflebacteria bacterium]
MDIYQLFSAISDLSNHDPRIRYKAIACLGTVKDSRSVAPLLNCISDSDRWCRIMSIRSLGQIGHPSAKAAIERLLSSDDSLILSTAIIALKNVGDEQSLNLVSGFLFDIHPRICADAVETVGELSWRLASRQHLPSIRPLLHSGNNRLVANAVVALCRNQETTPQEMVGFIREKLLSSSEKWTRASGVFVLGAIGFGEEELIKSLNDQSIDVVVNVIRALGRIKNPASVHALVDLLARENIRHKVVIALGELGEKKASQALIKYFSTSNIAVQRKIIESLGKIADPSAISLLIEKLDDTHLALEAITALGRMHHPEASKALISMIHKPLSSESELTIIDALGNTGDPAIIPTLMDLLQKPQPPRIFETVSWALARFGKAAVPALFSLLSDPKASQYALKAFSEFKDEAVPLLIDHLKDPKNYENAMKAIVQIGETAIPFLRAAFRDESADSALKLLICKCMYRILSPNSLEFFIQNLESDDTEIRRFSAFVLPMFENFTSFEREIQSHLASVDPLVRIACVRALSHSVNDAKIQGLLTERLEDPYWGVRYYALEAISEIDSPELLGQFKTLIQSKDQIVSRKAVQQYMKVCGVSIKDLIDGTNFDSALLQEIFPILKNISTAEEVGEIIPLLGNSEPKVVDFANNVLLGLIELSKPVLIEQLQNPDPIVRSRIAILLGKSGSFEAIPIIADILRKEVNPRVQKILVQSLSLFGIKATPIIFSLLGCHEHKEDLQLQELLYSALETLNQGQSALTNLSMPF